MTRDDITPDGIAMYSVPSRKRAGIVYHPAVGLCDGSIDCDCANFRMRLSKLAQSEHVKPDIGTPRYQCYCIQAAIADCISNGEIRIEK